MTATRRCFKCHRKTDRFGLIDASGYGLCRRCAQKHCVRERPKKMSWRQAFYNLVHHGTFTPPPPKEELIKGPDNAPVTGKRMLIEKVDQSSEEILSK